MEIIFGTQHFFRYALILENAEGSKRMTQLPSSHCLFLPDCLRPDVDDVTKRCLVDLWQRYIVNGVVILWSHLAAFGPFSGRCTR